MRLNKKQAIFLAFVSLVHLPLQASQSEALTSAISRIFSEPGNACSPYLPDRALDADGALHGFYAGVGFAGQWQQPDKKAALVEQLQQRRDDGFDLEPYRIDFIVGGLPEHPTAEQNACLDLVASHSYLLALQNLSQGLLPPDQREPFWRPKNDPHDVSQRLLDLAWGGLPEPARAFELATPAWPQYGALRKAYAQRLGQPDPNWPQLPAGKVLKPGEQDERIPLLVSRLLAEGYLSARSTTGSHYDAELVAAIKHFQYSHGLQDDGVIGPATLRALNIPASARLAQLRVNLERWRWLASELPQETLLVDIAGSKLQYLKDSGLVWQTRVQVGRPTRQTPQLRSYVSRLTLNPTWTAPPTILREDMLPKIRRDLGYLARNHLRVIDFNGNPLDPASIDWNRPGAIMIRQDAGSHNPLGRLVVRFANPFDVYLHDTPSQGLFSRSERALSSGCVRVEGIRQLLGIVLPATERDKVEQRIESGETVQYPVKDGMPIVLAYWTADIERNGNLILRNDIYDLDQPLLKKLDKRTRQVASLAARN